MKIDAYIESKLNIEYVIDAIRAGLLRDICEACFEKFYLTLAPIKQAEKILTALFLKLIKGVRFDQFLKKIPKKEQSLFLSHLLFHIFHLNLPVEHLVNEETITFYLIKVLAAKASKKTIKRMLSDLDPDKQKRLQEFCRHYFDEGSYRLFSLPTNPPTLADRPEKYIQGIKMITFAIPTRGKDLSLLAWLESTVKGLSYFTDYFSLNEPIPIFVFDQSEEALFQKNSQYIRSLKAPIIHIGRDAMGALAKRLNIEKLCITDKNEYGYGGARNAIFLVTPLLKYYYDRKIDYRILKNSTLQRDFQEVVLKEKRGPCIIHMGDDDLFMPPSAFFQDALFACEHKHEYFSRYGLVTGRKTTIIATTFDLQAVQARASDLVLQHTMQDEPYTHGMASLLTKPKLGLNLPFGAEEAYFFAMHNYYSDTKEPAIHLSGERYPEQEIPKNRYSGLAELLRSHYRYMHGMLLVVDLIDPPNRRKKSILPWNQRKKPFKTLYQAIQYMVKDATTAKMQKGYQINFNELKEQFKHYIYNPMERPEYGTLSLKALETVDPSKAKTKELRLLFEELKRDYKHFKAYLEGERSDYGQNLTHSLALLTESIEKATFQKALKGIL